MPRAPQDEFHSPMVDAFAGGHFSIRLSFFLFQGDFAIVKPFIPNDVLNLKFMSLLLIEILVIMFDPDGPHDNALEKIPNFKPKFAFFLDVVPDS